MSGYPRGNGSGHVVSDHRDLRSAAEIRNLYNWRSDFTLKVVTIFFCNKDLLIFYILII